MAATLTQDQLLETIDSMTVLELSQFIKAFEERYGVRPPRSPPRHLRRLQAAQRQRRRWSRNRPSSAPR